VSLTTGVVNLAVAVIGAIAVLGAALIQRRGSMPPEPDTPVRSPTQPRARSRTTLYTVAIISLVVGFLAGSVVAQALVSSRLKMPAVHITTPRNGAVNQPNIISVRGTYTSLHKGQWLWSASRYAPDTHDPSFNAFLPYSYSYHRPCSVLRSGTFTCETVQLGSPRDKGKTFEVLVMVSDAPCCVGPLPPRTLISDVIKVTRQRP
jgi:hypothetical protein